ncbi:MAG: hypothetical protein AB1896_10335 [Thermodesulfobacteriota bacterium]
MVFFQKKTRYGPGWWPAAETGGPKRNNRGAILLGLIVAMVIFATLSVVMVNLTSTSAVTSVAPNQSWRAYYLGESGYRYAASEFLHAGDGLTGSAASEARDDRLETLHQQADYTVDGAGGFTLAFYPYYYQTEAKAAGVPDLTATALAHVPIAGTGRPGWIQVRSASAENFYQYTSVTVAEPSVFFNGVSAEVPAGKVFPAALAASAVFNNGGSITLADNTGADLFPSRNGLFRIEEDPGVRYYFYRQRVGNTLNGLSFAGGSGTPFGYSPAGGDKVVLERVITLVTTGWVGQGRLSVSRDINYQLALVAGDEGGSGDGAAPEYEDDFSDGDLSDDWVIPAGGSGWAIEPDIDGDAALHVAGSHEGSGGGAERGAAAAAGATGGGGDEYAFLGSTLGHFEQAWNTTDKKLSYDVQMKISTYDFLGGTGYYPPYYLDGLSFRVNQAGGGGMKYLAVSFLRTRNDRHGVKDGIDDALLSGITATKENVPMIVLWEYLGEGSGQKKVLAYKQLSNANHVIHSDMYLRNWSTLLVRIQEKEEGGVRFNDIQVYYSDKDGPHGTPGTSLTDEGRLALIRGHKEWPVAAADLTSGNDYFTLVTWDNWDSTLVTAREGDTVIRLADTNFLTDFVSWPSDRPEVGIHSFGDSWYYHYFDDVGLRFPCDTCGSTGLPPGFQEPTQN